MDDLDPVGMLTDDLMDEPSPPRLCEDIALPYNVARPCGCPPDYHLADCPILAPAYEPDPGDLQDAMDEDHWREFGGEG